MEDMPQPSPIGDTTTRACLHFATAEKLLEMAAENDGAATCPRIMTQITRTEGGHTDEEGSLLEANEAEITVRVLDRCGAEITPSVFSTDGFVAKGHCMMSRYVCIMPTRQV
jgi:hypothetical protein